jgi:hypothetical protein
MKHLQPSLLEKATSPILYLCMTYLYYRDFRSLVVRFAPINVGGINAFQSPSSRLKQINVSVPSEYFKTLFVYDKKKSLVSSKKLTSILLVSGASKIRRSFDQEGILIANSSKFSKNDCGVDTMLSNNFGVTSENLILLFLIEPFSSVCAVLL